MPVPSIAVPTHHAHRRPALHVAALVTLGLTFPLIFLGGLVTSHGAGMSVPDWPNSYGYNMFLFPVRQWTGGIFFEHTHRLLGTAVGFCATVLTLTAWAPAATGRGRRAIAWVAGGLLVANAVGTAAMVVAPDAFHLPPAARSAGAIVPQGTVTAAGIALTAAVAWFCRTREPRRWVRWLATACLIAVCVQGLLGGLRVDLRNLPLAMVHGCFAQATFCLMVVTAVVTGPGWRRADGRAVGRPLLGAAVATVAVVFAQLIVAAVMRHSGAGLAIPDLPLAYGHLLPPTNAAELAAANHERVWHLQLDPVTMGQVWLHFAHRVGAVVVSTAVVVLLAEVARTARSTRSLTTPAVVLGGLLVTQVTLGLATVYFRKPADVASAHVACGALVLATAVLIAVRAARLYVLRSPEPAARAAVPIRAGELVAA